MSALRLSDFNLDTAIAELQFVDPNLAKIQGEVLSILQQKLNPFIARMNSDFSLKITPASKFAKAPNASLSEEYINSVLVGINIDTEQEAPGQFTNFTDIAVYFIGVPIEGEEEAITVEMWQRGAAVRGVLYQFLGGYMDTTNRRCWNELKPLPYQALPEVFGSYSGITVNFKGLHNPGHRLWSTTP